MKRLTNNPNNVAKKVIDEEQRAYELGYANPSEAHATYAWRKVLYVNAFFCGQRDRINGLTAAAAFDPSRYNVITGERKEIVEYDTRPPVTTISLQALTTAP